MKTSNICKLHVIPTGKPSERTWQSKEADPKTGIKREGAVPVLRATMIPQNPGIDPSRIQEIEFNINATKNGISNKNIADIAEIYYENKADFESGKAYLEVATYMAPRISGGGVCGFFTPWINDAVVVKTSEEDIPFVMAALSRDEQV